MITYKDFLAENTKTDNIDLCAALDCPSTGPIPVASMEELIAKANKEPSLAKESKAVYNKVSKISDKYIKLFNSLSPKIQDLAVKTYLTWSSKPDTAGLNFERLRANPNWYSIRVGSHYKAIFYNADKMWIWHWIGTHEEYNKLIEGTRPIIRWHPPEIPSK